MKHIDDELSAKLKHLASLPDSEYPFVSMYLNVNASQFLEQKEKNKIFIKNSIQENMEMLERSGDKSKIQCFAKDVEKIKHYVDNHIFTKTHGLAIFACSQMNVFEVFQSIQPFDNEFVVNAIPHLKQLVYQADEYENALVVMLESRYSKIFDVKLGGNVSNKLELISDVHKFHKQGGWAQLRYQRGIETEKQWHYRDTAFALTKFADVDNYENIIILGTEDDTRNFMKQLPKRVADKVISMNNISVHENINVILESVVNDLSKREREKEEKTVSEIVTRTESHDGCAMGLDEIAELARSGRIRMLAIVQDSDFSGFKCDDLLFTSYAQYGDRKSRCSGDLKQTDLAQEIIKLTIKNNGDVDIIPNETPAGKELMKHEGIGAYLRY